MSNNGTIVKISGPLVVARGLIKTRIYDMVRVGRYKLFGEVVEIRGDEYFIQVYEETEGLGPGEPVYPTYAAFSVELGPGLIGAIFDGIQRPMDAINRLHGNFIVRGIEQAPLDRTRKWHFIPLKWIGDKVVPGDVIGYVQESKIIRHKIMVPFDVKGKLLAIEEKKCAIEEIIAKVETSAGLRELTMFQRCPVRTPRTVQKKQNTNVPLVTGQRIIDMFFPVTKGGVACIPGPFGSGKTVIQHQLSRWADADIIVYVGCGERGNEMTEVLVDFPVLKDPKTGEPLMERTVLIANTSNMPVAAREASVFTGITIAEYYRDMGYSVALMADSTSRWGEAMREISSRLEEMPGEEGFPTYIGSRLASFYERAGNVICSGSDERRGSLSVIGAVSPPGGDLSEPVTQATLRVVKAFWGLDDGLASQRHFPAINWLNSYSLYQDVVDNYSNANIGKDWKAYRVKAMNILQKEAELEELVRLVGVDSLSPKDRLIMETARLIREDFLYQNAYDIHDTYTSLKKQYLMLEIIIKFYDKVNELLQSNVELSTIISISSLSEIAQMRFIPEENLGGFDKLEAKMMQELEVLSKNNTS
ncbi:MAG TPA: V-type ATP synthase subunit A [Candidatus Wujingus californicus]|uniref:V-type ATP synthase subunit A n=1 Tax=Candidatus Wujingus californicus TaxID=3367618 RepID=UPI001D96FF29|nr:V-type ATP synthase subunit A [Planctomycetota bacterium]MDO8130882.1 V-type ATP synthase subunit A [Candidatus Brocadiales bacterium]